MDSLFERPGWRAVGTIAGGLLAAGALTWVAVSAMGDQSPEPTPTPSISPDPIQADAAPPLRASAASAQLFLGDHSIG
ncbi:MAG: hypothetical protein MUP36_01295 [Demequinaceae bacterium]|nr:hypothetical protein [Demequinaceae bacterium]